MFILSMANNFFNKLYIHIQYTTKNVINKIIINYNILFNENECIVIKPFS